MHPPASADAEASELVVQRAVRRAERAVYVVFGAAGLSMSTWASRIPQVRDHFQLSPRALGFVLLAVACGSLVSLPLAGPLVARTGSRQVVGAMALLFGSGVAMVAIGYQVGLAMVVAGLVTMGFAAGAWDVAMNVQGAFVEQLLGRSVMARFHAGFSLGTVVGAAIGVGMVAAEVSVTVHLLAAGVVIATSAVALSRRFVADHARASHGTEHPVQHTVQHTVEHIVEHTVEPLPRRGHFAAWREPRTLLIGLFVLAFAFAEGVGNDWIAVAAIDGYGTSEAVGTVVFACFLVAMTAGRWFGPMLLDRHGRAAVVRVAALVALAGALLFVTAPYAWLAVVGALFWGLGTSLGFPVGMSAGADEPAFAAGRVSVISSIGYCAFLVGPPLIGFLGDRFTVLSALTAVVVLMALAAVLAPIVQAPPSPAANGD